MPIKRANLYRTSYYRKLIGYYVSCKERIYERAFGFTDIRVLALTSSRYRIKNMVAACREIDKSGEEGRKFLFAQTKEFAIGNPMRVFEKVWRNARDDEPVRLFD